VYEKAPAYFFFGFSPGAVQIPLGVNRQSVAPYKFAWNYSGGSQTEKYGKDGWLKSSQFVQLSAAPQLQPSDTTIYSGAI
jgi:hypothetical protein